jgi:eukaryotic-like serine/threonine-protein kinase
MSPIKLGRYNLIRLLGKGAMGLVYEGRDPNLNRRVAIKTIKVDNLSDQAASEYDVRFRTEAHSAARLQHPNIVSVYDSDRDGDIAFLVLEFVEGHDLKHHLDRGEVFTLAQTLGIMSDLLSALEYAHKQKIVHRDVKPANLLVQASGRIKLADFGVARIQDSGDATRTQGSIVGTLKYMSPEQLEGRPIDARADLFAAGVVLYQLLTSKRPFDGDTDFAVIQNIVGLRPPAVTFHNPGLPPALDAVVAKSLAKSRDQRFATADEFMDALRQASKNVADDTITPQKLLPAKGITTTWTSTMVAGDSLVATQAGFGTGSGTSANSSLISQEVELVYWKDIRESDDVPDLQRFLLKFPNGIYADLARRKLKLLGVVPVNEASESAPVPAERIAPKATAAPSVRAKPEAAPSARAKSEAAPAKRLKVKVASKPAAGKAPAGSGWLLAGLAAIALAGVALKMMPAGGPVSAPAAAASAPLSAASAASASLWLGPGETAVVSFGADAPASRSATPVLTPVVTSVVAPPFAAPTAPLDASSAASLSVPPLPAASSASSAAVARLPLSPASAAIAAQRQAARMAAASAAAAARRAAPVTAAASSSSDGPAQAAIVSVPAPLIRPATPAATNAIGACEGRVLFGFQNCMREQCAKPAFAQSAVCVERRQMDDRRRDADKAG